jgi:hypothetical protein
MGLQPGAGNTRDTTEESRPEMILGLLSVSTQNQLTIIGVLD